MISSQSLLGGCMTSKSFQVRTIVIMTLVLATAFVMLEPAALSQQVTAVITGRVVDPSGAVMPGAKVIAKSVERGTEYTTETNAEGLYKLPLLPIGTYDLRVEMTGFQTAVRSGVVLELNQTARIDFEMKIGEVTQTVEVTEATPVLNTDTMQVGTIIDSQVNVSLPLATRNYIQLTLLSPGATHPSPNWFTGAMQGGFGSGRPYVNGNREQSNNFLLDGLDNNQVSDNLVGYQPAPDAIAEFNMITNNAPADFGNFQGGIISATIKSGTNELHGTVYEFLRNDVLNANTWENNWQGSPKGKVRWNQFGVAAGGPIIKNRVFLFGDYAGRRINFPASTSTLSVFTAKERVGDFSELCQTGFTNGICNPATAGSGLRSIQLYDPLQANYVNGQRVPFLNNQIPLSRMDIVAQNLFSNGALYPSPINGDIQNNQVNTSVNDIVADQYDLKTDANLTDMDKLSGRFSWSRQNSPVTNTFPLFFGSFSYNPIWSAVTDWTHTFSPHIVNDFRMGVNYVSTHSGGTDNGLGNVADELGIQGVNTRTPGLNAMNFSGGFISNFGSANIGTQQLFPSTVIQFTDSLMVMKGTHTLHFGFQFMRERINPFYAGNYGRTGQINYDGRWTAGPSPNAVSGSGSGSPEADFFLGLPYDVQRGVDTGTWGQRSSVISGWVADEWRTTPTLTLNYGLRYETHTPWVEVYNRQTNFAPFTGEVEAAGQSTYYTNSRALYNNYNWGLGDVQPRFGFAWNPKWMNSTFVIRGAYTISSYLEGTGTNLRLTINPPYTTEYNNDYSSLTYPLSTTEQGMTVLQSTDPYQNATLRLWDPDVKPAIVQQWSLIVEKQFGQETTLTAGYIGQHGTHLMVPMPYFQRQLLGVGADGTPITAPSPYLAGNPALANISQISGTESNGNQRYDALQVTLRKRYSQGLQYQVAYTFSKCMSDSLGYYGSWSSQTSSQSAYFQNLYDRAAEWGPCFFDQKNNLTGYVVYQLPIGKGKSIGSDWHPVARGILGNWEVSGILTLRGGFASTISGPDASGTHSRGPRGNCIGPVNIYGIGTNSDLGGFQYFDPSAFTTAAPGTFGTCGVGTFYGPGMTSFDLGVFKDFLFTERYRIQFRSEFINFTNTPIFNAPDTYASPTMGRITSTQGARQIQFALKFLF
jgi:hypothetical protein